MAITKSVDFFAPYLADTFNANSNKLIGSGGMLSGGAVTVLTATTVSIAPYSFIQNGIIVAESSVTTPISVPDFSASKETVFIVVNSPNSKTTSGVTLSVVEGYESVGETSVVIAYRSNGVWTYPPKISLTAVKTDTSRSIRDISTGRMSGARTEFGYNLGGDQAIRVHQGVALEADGTRRLLPTNTAVAYDIHAHMKVNNVDPDFHRVDHVLLRKKRNGISDIVVAKGDTIRPGTDIASAADTASIIVDASVGSTTPSVAENFIGEHIVMWGNGSDLMHNILDNGVSRFPAGASTALSLGAAVKDVYVTARPNMVSGDRLYGVCSVGAAGSEEIYIFRTAADGAGWPMNAYSITSMTNGARKPHMVIDENGYAHIVFQHNESAGINPNNQVYYIKYNLADTTFGTATAVAVSARFAAGFNSGQNDTNPGIAIDLEGKIHITWIKGTGNHTYGDVMYLVISQSGATIEAKRTISNDVSNGLGVLHVDNADNVKPRISCTPHGNIFIGWITDTQLLMAPQYVVMFSRDMKGRIGFTSVVTAMLDPGLTPPILVSHFDVFSDALGRICALLHVTDSIPVSEWRFYKFSPVLVSDGVIAYNDMLTASMTAEQTTINGIAPSETDDSARACLDINGSLQIVDVLVGIGITHYKYSSQCYLGPLSKDTGILHESDSLLGTVSIPKGSSNVVVGQSDVLEQPRRSASVPTILAVGRDGDYAGYSGIHQAVNSLRGLGGKVIVKGGYHKLINKLTIPPGVELIADGHTVIDVFADVDGPITILGNGTTTVGTVSAIHKRFGTGTYGWQRGWKPGDAILAYDLAGTQPIKPNTNYNGPYFITKVYIFSADIGLNVNISALIAGMTNARIIHLAAGARLDGFTIYDNRATAITELIDVQYCFAPVFEGLKIYSPGAVRAVYQKSCLEASWRDCHISNDAGGYSIQIDGNTDMADIATNVSDCRLKTDIVPGADVSRLKIINTDVYTTGSWDIPVVNVHDFYVQQPVMVAEQRGLVLSGVSLDEPYDYSKAQLGAVISKSGKTPIRYESTGRIAGPNRFFDDFCYANASSTKNWCTAGVPSATNTPHEYEIGAFGATTSIAPFHNSSGYNAGGILKMSAGPGTTDSIALYGSFSFAFDPSANQTLSFMGRMLIPFDGSEENLHRTYELGLASSSPYSIHFLYDAAAVASTLSIVVTDTLVTTTIDTTILPPIDQFINLYITVQETAVYAWVTGMTNPVVVPIGGVGEPRGLSALDAFGPWVRTTDKVASAAAKALYIDYLEVWKSEALSG